jgi:SlyX protein
MSSDTQGNDSTMGLSSAPDDWTRRMEALESRIAFQEHWLDTLDDAVAGQEQRLTRLERLNTLMQERLRDQQRALQENDTAASRPEDELPPHY